MDVIQDTVRRWYKVKNMRYSGYRSALGRTPRDIREWTQPPDFQYSVY